MHDAQQQKAGVDLLVKNGEITDAVGDAFKTILQMIENQQVRIEHLEREVKKGAKGVKIT